MPVALFATLDTKGTEAEFLRDRLRDLDVPVRLVDTGCLGEPGQAADVSRDVVFAAAGTSAQALQATGDRGQAVTAAADGAAALAVGWSAAGELEGVIGLGGSAGTTIATAAMRALPLGVPKVMVSTLASGQVRPWVGDSDVMMLNSIVDIAGLNHISRSVLDTAARAMAGLVSNPAAEPREGDRPMIAATMFGVTTPCVERARQRLEDSGFEVLVFHATGNGGQAMESLIEEDLFVGVLDVTTTELADELVGGTLSAGPGRLTAAGRRAVPQVISVGATDMVNFGPRESVPAAFAERQLLEHNPTVTLMRTTIDENRSLGEHIAQKASRATGPTCLMLPLEGVSAVDRTGQPFDDPDAREALFAAVREHHGDVELVEVSRHINDHEFADAAAQRLVEMIQASGELSS